MQKGIRRWVGAVLLGAVGLVGWAALVGPAPLAGEETTTTWNSPASQTGASPIEKRLEELSDLLKRFSKDLTDLTSRVAGLEKHTLESLEPELKQIHTTLKVVADEVSSVQPVPHVVTFRGMVQNDLLEIKQQLQKMAERFGTLSGRLVVENYTGVLQTLRVNGKDYLVPAGQMIIYHVPVPEVEVYLPYHEPPKRYSREVWRQVGPNEYEFTLHIRPKQGITVFPQQ